MEIVVLWKGRGAVVAQPQELVRLCPGAITLPLGMVRGVPVRRFSCQKNGLPAITWAKFWLSKKDKKAVAVSTAVELELLVKESAVSRRQAVRSFKRTISAARAEMKNKARGKGRDVTGTVCYDYRSGQKEATTVGWTVVK